MTSPLSGGLREDVPAAAAATPQDVVVGTAPHAGTVTEVTFTPEASITGTATNFRTFRLVNKGQAGAGTTVVASLAFSAGTVTAPAFDEKVIPLIGGAAVDVVAGDVLVWDEVVTGTGLASPGGQVKVTVSRGNVSA